MQLTREEQGVAQTILIGEGILFGLTALQVSRAVLLYVMNCHDFWPKLNNFEMLRHAEAALPIVNHRLLNPRRYLASILCYRKPTIY